MLISIIIVAQLLLLFGSYQPEDAWILRFRWPASTRYTSARTRAILLVSFWETLNKTIILEERIYFISFLYFCMICHLLSLQSIINPYSNKKHNRPQNISDIPIEVFYGVLWVNLPGLPIKSIFERTIKLFQIDVNSFLILGPAYCGGKR